MTRSEGDGIKADMVPDWLARLLVLQDRDGKRLSLESQIRYVPREIESCESRIAGHRARFEDAQTRYRELELKRKELEKEIASAEEQVVRYKNQQMQVKKNDEYQALTHEIELMQGKISELEEAEIEVLLQLDTEREKVDEADKVGKEQIAAEEQQIGRLKEREGNLKEQLVEAGQALEDARSEVPEAQRVIYERISARQSLPVVVPLRDQKCGGCHLRVSSGVASEVRVGDKITTCDNCGRILYWEA